jgi:hypothetical protein
MGNDPVNEVDPDGGSILDCTWKIFQHSNNWALLGLKVFVNGLNILTTESSIQANKDFISSTLKQGKQNAKNNKEDEKLNVSIVIPNKNGKGEYYEGDFYDMDGVDEGDWHFIVAKNIGDAKIKLKRYLKKRKADNIILDSHGSNGGINVDEDQNTISENSFDIYPKNQSEYAKKSITDIVEIGESTKSSGNFLITSCTVCYKDDIGKKIGNRLAELTKRNLYLSSGFSRGTIAHQGGKPVSNIGGDLSKIKGGARGYIKFKVGLTPQRGNVFLNTTGKNFKFVPKL